MYHLLSVSLQEQELQSLRVAHSRRLELLKAEQRSSHLLREQLKTYDRHPQRCCTYPVDAYVVNSLIL